MSNLTNEQIARVFAMYYSEGARHIHAGDNDEMYYVLSTCMDKDREEEGKRIYDWHEWKLLLNPLSAISDEDAIEVAKIFYGQDTTYSQDILIQDGRRFARQPSWVSQYPLRFLQIYNFLVEKSYAVPLPFVWAEGKTAIELGIAIDKTTVK